MPSKRNQTGKKSRSTKKSKSTTIVDGLPTTEMTHEQLETHIVRLRNEIDRERNERIFFNLEKDKVTNFWEITKKQLEECSSELRNKEREFEEAEERHQMEIKIYRQKIKHLLYEKNNDKSNLLSESSTALKLAQEHQMDAEKNMRYTNLELKKQMRDNSVQNHIGIVALTNEYERKLNNIREDFLNQLDEQKQFYEGRIAEVEKKMDLCRRNDLHDMEERKNQHISGLLNKHEKSLFDMKTYYNDITANNLKLIINLKEQLSEKQKKIDQLDRQLSNANEEKRQMAEPLKNALEENRELRRRMTNYEKDLKSLEITKSKLKASEKERRERNLQLEIVKQRFMKIEKERDALYEKFLAAIQEVQQKTGLKNLLLEKRLSVLKESVEKNELQLCQVLAASNLDPDSADTLKQKVEDIIGSKNSAIRELEYELARVCKAHNDLVATCTNKLAQLGIPVEELGFEPLKDVARVNVLGKTPAGLISVPP